MVVTSLTSATLIHIILGLLKKITLAYLNLVVQLSVCEISARFCCVCVRANPKQHVLLEHGA